MEGERRERWTRLCVEVAGRAGLEPLARIIISEVNRLLHEKELRLRNVRREASTLSKPRNGILATDGFWLPIFETDPNLGLPTNTRMLVIISVASLSSGHLEVLVQRPQHHANASRIYHSTG